MAVSIGFAVNQEVRRGWGSPLASGPEPPGSDLASSFLRSIPVLLFFSLSCALIITSKSKHVFFKSRKVNK